MKQDTLSHWYDDIDRHEALRGQPLREAANQSDNGALEIAKLLIQSMVLLHGGALVALPTFISAKVGFDQPTLERLLKCFSTGLVLALLAGVVAFFALGARNNFYMKRLEAAPHHAYARAAQIRFINTQHQSFQEIEQQESATAATLEQEAEPLITRFNTFRYLGVILLLGSMIALLRASLISIDQL